VCTARDEKKEMPLTAAEEVEAHSSHRGEQCEFMRLNTRTGVEGTLVSKHTSAYSYLV
jgi:hypothetical protein